MKSESPLSGCYQQTHWAKAAIDKLQSDIREFVAIDPYEIVSEVDIQAAEEIWRFRINRDLPPQMFIDVGHILASLRDPLDNVLAILSDKYIGNTKGVGFPFQSTMKDCSTDLKKVEKLLPDGAGDLIRGAKTHPGGNAHLRALHSLNIDKKHRLSIGVGLGPLIGIQKGPL